MQRLLITAFITFLIGISAGLYFIEDENNTESPLAKMNIGGNFMLHAADEDIYLTDYKGKVVLMFFGYTSCPDICPTTLFTLGSVLNKLAEEEAEKVKILFISVDPERDTPEIIDKYTQYYHADILGISGSKQEIDAVVKQYASAYRKIKSDSAIGYLVDHSSAIYLVNPDGDLVNLLPGDSAVDSIVETIRNLL